jgi:hypothetical protein
MTAFNFKPRFVPKIIDRTKTQTVRAERKDGWRPEPGTDVQLYTGLRTSRTKLIGKAKLISITSIQIDWAHSWVDLTKNGKQTRIDCWKPGPLNEFARADGFENWEAFWTFFRVIHPDDIFTGFVVTWGDTFVPA